MGIPYINHCEIHNPNKHAHGACLQVHNCTDIYWNKVRVDSRLQLQYKRPQKKYWAILGLFLYWADIHAHWLQFNIWKSYTYTKTTQRAWNPYIWLWSSLNGNLMQNLVKSAFESIRKGAQTWSNLSNRLQGTACVAQIHRQANNCKRRWGVKESWEN